MKSIKVPLLIVISYALIMSAMMPSNGSISGINQELSTPLNTNVVTLSSIEVGSDFGFISAGFNGTGSEGNPYILDGSIVTTHNLGYGIYIHDTSAHFIIQNCLVNLTGTGSSTGIFLDYISNGTIYNCTVLGTGTGIYVGHSSDVSVLSSYVNNCTAEGIYASSSSRIDLMNNTITDIDYQGINTLTCNNVAVIDNLIMRINYDGVQSWSKGINCESGENLTIQNNEVRSTIKGDGIGVWSMDNAIVESNLVWDCYKGIYVYNSPELIVQSNNISRIYVQGILFLAVENATVMGNSIHHTIGNDKPGIALATSSMHNLIQGNDIFECFNGITIDSSSGNNTIFDNNIGWIDFNYGDDDRTASPTNNWTFNQFSNFAANPYAISGSASTSDTNASLLSDVISPTIDSPSDITINDTDTDMWVTWHPNERFPGYFFFYINDSNIATYPWDNSSISLPLDSYAPGVYDMRVLIWDASYANSIQDTVRVTVLDTQAPVFTSATGDYAIEYGERVWTNFTATDDTPNLKYAYEDEAGPYWGNSWTSGFPINWDHGFPNVGEHNFTVVLTDKSGNSAKATCIVTVEDTTAPTSPDFPEDFSEETGTDAWVNFTLNEHYYDAYEIWLDDVMDVSTSYSDGEYITYMLNFDTPGEYNVTVVAWDDYSNTMKDTCIVTYVDSTGPDVVGPTDFIIEAGETDMVSWTWTELDPMNYSIYENNSLEVYSTTFSGDIQYTLDGLTPGNWNITLIFYDKTGNYAKDEVWVTVEDTTAPTLIGYGNFLIEGGESANVTWDVIDIDPWDYDGTFQVFVNETQETSGVWNSAELFYLFDPEVGLYNVTLVIVDAYGNSAYNTTWVTGQDTTAPTLVGLSTFDVELGEEHQLNWTVTDIDSWDQDGLWVIFINGTEEYSGIWDSLEISFVFGPEVGVYNVTLIVTDANGNSVTDVTWVTCEDTTPPIIEGVDDQEIEEGSSVLLNWTCSDLDPATLVLQRNGSEIVSQEWNGEDISILADGLSPGVYNFTLTITDASGNSAQDTVFLTVTAIATSSTSTTSSTTSTTTSSSDTGTGTTIPPTDDGLIMILAITGVGGSIVVVIIILAVSKKRK